MAQITSAGIGSNLDVNGIVTQLMQVERRPIALLDAKEIDIQAKISAFGAVKGAVATFESAMAAFADAGRFRSVSSIVGDAALASATATSAAVPGKYQLEVQALAQAQKLKTATAFAATTDTLGSGTLTIQFGTYGAGAFTANADKPAKTISIPAGANSLAAVRDAINAANAGITATVINDGTGNRLVLASRDPGAANALRITVADDDGDNTDAAGLSQLAYDVSTGGTANLAQTVAAQNATVVIDGITVSKASNTIADAIEGITLNLAKAAPGTTTTLTVARENSAARSTVDGFVQAYNELLKTVRDLSKYDAATGTGATLQGDAALRTIETRMRRALGTPLGADGGGLSRLSDIGVSFQKDGRLALDNVKLDKVLADPAKDVATVFAALGKPADSLVEFTSATANVADGRYALSVTQLATRGATVGSAPAATTITAGVNDGLSVTVDDVATSVTLTAGTYTAAQLAAEIQSRVNGALGASAAVTVSQSGGTLTMTSNRYGSGSTVAIVGGTAAADLFGTATATAGLDVAGTINGQAATGSGQSLAGAGLTLKVRGGATGDRGTVAYARGFAAQLRSLATELLGDDGALEARTEGLGKTVAAIAAQRAALEARMEQIEKRYRAQFTALDKNVSAMKSTSAFLTQQLATLNTNGGSSG